MSAFQPSDEQQVQEEILCLRLVEVDLEYRHELEKLLSLLNTKQSYREKLKQHNMQHATCHDNMPVFTRKCTVTEKVEPVDAKEVLCSFGFHEYLNTLASNLRLLEMMIRVIKRETCIVQEELDFVAIFDTEEEADSVEGDVQFVGDL